MEEKPAVLVTCGNGIFTPDHQRDLSTLFDATSKRDENHIYQELIQLPHFGYTQHSAALYRPKWTQEEYWKGLQRIIIENNLA